MPSEPSKNDSAQPPTALENREERPPIAPSSSSESGVSDSVAQASQADAHDLQEILITARGEGGIWNLAELWQYRELGLFFVWRDVVVHYKQTLLGIAWAIIKPALLTAIFTLFLGRVVGDSPAGTPYTLYVFAGLLLWNLFSTALGASANSVIGSERLITKVYFPRLLIPLAAIGPAVVDFLLGGAILLGIMLWYGVPPAGTSVLILLPLLVVMVCSAALGSCLAALNVVYRDIRHILPFLIQAWMFATPAIYLPTVASEPAQNAIRDLAREETVTSDSTTKVNRTAEPTSTQNPDTPQISRAWLICNPLNACVNFFRAALVGSTLPWLELGIAAVWTLIASVISGLVFHRLEDTFADVV